MYEEDAREFQPDQPVDILVLQNPGTTHNFPVKFVVNNGYVLCNNYHGTAQEMLADSNFIFVGLVTRSMEKEDVQNLDTKNLEECWQDIDSDEELEKDYFCFEQSLFALRKIFGDQKTEEIIKKKSVVTEYKKLIDFAKKQNPDSLAVRLIVYTKEDGEDITLEPLPNKKYASSDDLYIFKKNNN